MVTFQILNHFHSQRPSHSLCKSIYLTTHCKIRQIKYYNKYNKHVFLWSSNNYRHIIKKTFLNNNIKFINEPYIKDQPINYYINKLEFNEKYIFIARYSSISCWFKSIGKWLIPDSFQKHHTLRRTPSNLR